MYFETFKPGHLVVSRSILNEEYILYGWVSTHICPHCQKTNVISHPFLTLDDGLVDLILAPTEKKITFCIWKHKEHLSIEQHGPEFTLTRELADEPDASLCIGAAWDEYFCADIRHTLSRCRASYEQKRNSYNGKISLLFVIVIGLFGTGINTTMFFPILLRIPGISNTLWSYISSGALIVASIFGVAGVQYLWRARKMQREVTRLA